MVNPIALGWVHWGGGGELQAAPCCEGVIYVDISSIHLKICPVDKDQPYWLIYYNSLCYVSYFEVVPSVPNNLRINK